MKKLSILLLFICSTANAQFVTGQVLTAQQLNNAFANVLALTGGVLSGPLAAPTMTVTGNLTVNGTFTLNGGLLPSSLAPQAANTALANVTGSTASPAAVALPSCSTANSALKYTSGTGWSCGTSYALTTGTLAQFAATTSAQLAGVISDETGSGSLVFGTNPTVSGATISGGTISNTPISGNTGSFSTLSASSTVSGAGFTSLLSPYAPLASPTFTGTVTIPGGASISGYLTSATAASTYAPLASPALTGTPTAPTASAGTSTTQVATTAFAQTAVTGGGNAGKFTTLQATSASHLLYTNNTFQSFTSGTAATVTTWTSTYDLNSNFNASTGTFTAPAAGYYLVTGQLLFTTGSGSAGNTYQAIVLKNGSGNWTGWNTLASASQSSIVVTFNVILQLAAADTVSIQGKQNSGTAQTLVGGSPANFLSISQLP